MERCTTDREQCKDPDSFCCCRALQVEELDILCADPNVEKNLDRHLMTNASQCSCTPCGDVKVTVRLNVKGPGDDGPIPAAQVFDIATQQVIGLTLYNGMLDFETELEKQTLLLLIQATGYQRVTRSIKLTPTRSVIQRNITMARLVVVHIGHGKSEVVFPLGKWAWLCAEPGSFHKNGTTYEHDVMFKGSYMDSSNTEALDMLEGQRFEMDGNRFAMLAVVFLEFEDMEGDSLDVKDLRLALPLEGEEDDVDMFAAVHDWETGKWTQVSTFSPVKTSRRSKRQTISEVIREAPGIGTSVFITIAGQVAADCWLQVRTFDVNNDPFPGPFVSLVQTRVVGGPGGMVLLYRFGTDTGDAQTFEDGFASNAICLPLECNDFLEATLTATLDPNSQLSSVPFPPDTFGVLDAGTPTATGTSFTFDAYTPADIAKEPRPFYVFRDSCFTQAQEIQAASNPQDYFSFSTDYTPLLSSDQCYIKITVRYCSLHSTSVTITSLDSQTEDVNQVVTTPFPIASFIPGSGFPEECLNTCLPLCSFPQSVCLPYNCSNSIRITSQFSTSTGTTACELTDISVLLGNSVLAFRGGVMQEDLTIDTSVLDPDSLNNPDLGLYYDPQPTVARDLCLVGGAFQNPMGASITLEGSAGTFGCFS